MQPGFPVAAATSPSRGARTPRGWGLTGPRAAARHKNTHNLGPTIAGVPGPELAMLST